MFCFYPAGKSGKKGNFDSDAKLLVSSCKEANITGKTSNSSIKQAATSVVSSLSLLVIFLFILITFADNSTFGV